MKMAKLVKYHCLIFVVLAIVSLPYNASAQTTTTAEAATTSLVPVEAAVDELDTIDAADQTETPADQSTEIPNVTTEVPTTVLAATESAATTSYNYNSTTSECVGDEMENMIINLDTDNDNIVVIDKMGVFDMDECSEKCCNDGECTVSVFLAVPMDGVNCYMIICDPVESCEYVELANVTTTLILRDISVDDLMEAEEKLLAGTTPEKNPETTPEKDPETTQEQNPETTQEQNPTTTPAENPETTPEKIPTTEELVTTTKKVESTEEIDEGEGDETNEGEGDETNTPEAVTENKNADEGEGETPAAEITTAVEFTSTENENETIDNTSNQNVTVIETEDSESTDVSEDGNSAGVKFGDANKSGNEFQHTSTGALISALVFGVLFLISLGVLVGKRCYESYQRKDYKKIDYLVNGMYN